MKFENINNVRWMRNITHIHHITKLWVMKNVNVRIQVRIFFEKSKKQQMKWIENDESQ